MVEVALTVERDGLIAWRTMLSMAPLSQRGWHTEKLVYFVARRLKWGPKILWSMPV